MLHSGYTEVSIQTQTNTLTNRHVEFFMEQAHNALTLCKLHTHTQLCIKRASCNLAIQVIWITFTARGRFLVWIAVQVEVVGEEVGEERIQYLANNAELGSDLWGISLPLCNPDFPPFTYSHIHRLSNARKQIISFRLKAPYLVQIWNTLPPFLQASTFI